MEFSIEGYLHWKRTRLSSQNGTNDAGEAASRKKSHRRDSGDTCATAGQPDGSSSGSGIETIFLQYEVVRNILSRLPLHDLHSAAEVCSTWNSIANIILQSRTNLEWTMMTSSDFMLRKDFEEKFYCDPKLCILFSTRLKGRMSQLVYNHVGPDCPVLRVQGAGIVGARTGTLVTQEIEESVGSFGVSALFLPAIPNVKYSIFHLNKDKMETFTNKEEFTPAEVQNIFSIDPADEVKCLLLFCGSRSNLLTRLVSSVQERQTAKCVVAGGLCSLKRGNANGVVISGANVAAVSMLLPSTAIARSRVEEYFQKFQKDTRSIVAKRTVCFMFACVGRGMLMYNESNVESDLFRKYFPSTPLVGFFGYGEINSNLISGHELPVPFELFPRAKWSRITVCLMTFDCRSQYVLCMCRLAKLS